MRYIESLHIENFQSYKNETIHFKPGLNLLLGSSDCGKSAILRAISFVFYNYPRSNTIIHNGEKEVKVSVKFSDGTVVTRIRGDRNAYFAQDKNGKKYSFDKIDKSIPEEIKNLLNNPPEDEFNGFISYADQFSPMFLVDLSPTDLPRSLSNLTGIEILEECAKQLMQNYKLLDKQIKLQENDYIQLLDEYHSYDCVEDCQNQMMSINDSLDKYNQLCEHLEKLQHFDLNLEDVSEKDIFDLEKIIKKLDNVLVNIQTTKSLISKLNDLELFVLISFDYDKNDLTKIDAVIEKIFILEKRFAGCEKEIKIFDDYFRMSLAYEQIKNQGNIYSEDFKAAQKQLDEANEELSLYKKSLLEKNIMCETCGSILK
jgi:DNA repair ATPase RecN